MKNVRFLGWSRPLADLAAPQLLNSGYRCEPGNSVDLSEVLVLISGRHAIRSLNEKMTALLEPLKAGVFLPEYYTPERFVMEGADKFNVASEIEVVRVWKKVLESCTSAEYPNLFPKDFAEKNDSAVDYLARQFISLKRELSAGGHSVSSAIQKGVSADSERWNEILRLENIAQYMLTDAWLTDPENLKLKLADSVEEFRKFERIIVIGMPDLSSLLLKRLAKAAETMDVEIWVNAPESMAGFFDGWGRPIPELWTNYQVSFGDVEDGSAEIYKTDTVEQMASAAAALLVKNGRDLNGKIIAIGKEELFYPVRREVSSFVSADGKALCVINPSGEPMRCLRLFDILNRLKDFLTNSRFESADNLINHPDMLRYLSVTLKNPQGRILEQLDKFRVKHLPDLFEVVFQTAGQEVRPLFEHLRDLRNEFIKKPLDVLVSDWIKLIYSNCNPPPSHGIPLRSEIAELESVLKQIMRSPLYSGVPMTEQFGDLLNSLGSCRLYKQREAHDFSIGGFLELPWSDAREIILCGMSDGAIPENVRGSVFLSDSQRAFLGLQTNARRSARDLLYLESVLNSRPRGAVHFLASRNDAESKPLKFSRFFFQGERDSVLKRAALLYEPMRIPSPPLKTAGIKFVLQPDYSRAAGDERTVSVTSFKYYLESPFRFFLMTEMNMSQTDFEPLELDKPGFGTCCHAALERAGNDTDPERMKKRLFDELDNYMKKTYGSPLPVLLAVQNEQIKQRLAWAAGCLAESAHKYHLLEQEYKLGGDAGFIPFAGLRIRGRIDRIDYNKSENILRLIDYKTIDDGKTPADVHIDSKGNFLDLQLPLYRMLLPLDANFKKKYPEIDFTTVRILCGYLSMPKKVTDTQFQIWDELELHLSKAESEVVRIASEIRGFTEGVFRENPEEKHKYDNFKQIFLPDLRTAVPSANWGGNE